MIPTYIGIGASAGGLAVLKELVKNLPTDSSNVYIIAQHLDKNKKSSLVEILSRYSTIPTLEADKNCNFLTNHIYIIPPKYNLIVKNNRLTLKKTPSTCHTTTPCIDIMLKSLAFYAKRNAIGIILTGTGHDGTLGLEKIKEHQGVSIVQSPEEAEYKGMPQNAIDAQQIDYILSLKQIAKYLHDPLSIKKDYKKTNKSNQLEKIKKLLNKKENLNIEKYKDETIIRRINKRMSFVHSQTMQDYIKFIDSNPEELHLLHQNILIGVTDFFRDKEAFKSLETELFSYLKDKPQDYELRIWSVACSSGQETYSLAILISKIGKQLKKSFSVRIFATDIDDTALTKARTAVYSEESLKEIDKNLIDEYFISAKNGYKVIQSLRQQIVFTKHNILKDPPFINNDMISCRNLLIYLLPEAQKEILTLFHHSLKKNGLLFLGSSESTILSLNCFYAINSEHKIYKKQVLSKPPKISSHYFSKHLETENGNIVSQNIKTDAQTIEDKLAKTVFTFFAQECVVVNRNFSIIYKKGNLPFLKLSDGFVTLNILENIDKKLRHDVRMLLENAFESQNTQQTKFIEIEIPTSQTVFIRIIAYPFEYSSLLLYFQQLSADDLQFNTEKFILPNEASVIKSLNTQLKDARNELHSLSDKLIVHEENAQALSEELQSANEELQSSNEELETSNEELQSSNEELQSSILDIQKLKQELSLILNSSKDAIIGLDTNGNNTFVNNAATKMLGYSRDELIGKNGHNLWHHSKADGSHYPQEECTLHSSFNSKETNIRNEDVFWKKNGTSFEVEVLRSPIIKNNKIEGILLSFHDITEKNRLKKIHQHEHQLADFYLNLAGNIVMQLDLKGNIKIINKEGCKVLQSSRETIIGKNWFDNFIPPKIHDKIKKAFISTLNQKTPAISNYKNKIIDTKNQEHTIFWTNGTLKDISGNITSVITSGIDITKEEQLSQKLFEQEHLYKLTFEEADIGIAHISLENMWIDTNEYLSTLLGYTKNEFKKMSIFGITHPDDINNDKTMVQDLLNKKRNSYSVEKRFIHKNGKIIWVNINVVLLKDEEKSPTYFLKIIRDISENKMLLYQLETERNEMKNIIEFNPIPSIMHNENGKIILINHAWESNTGYSKEEILNMDIYMKKLYRNINIDHKEMLKDYYKSSMDAQEKKHIITTKDGKEHIWFIKSTKLHGNAEIQNNFISSVIDITDIQNKDNIMISQSRQAAMGDMLAMISHQWRQPLSVISMTTNTLQAQQELDEEITPQDIQEAIKTINEQIFYLSNTIDDFRNFFKPEKEKEKISVSSIFKKLATLIQKSLQNNSIDLKFPKKQDIEIFTYPNQLIQILLNFTNNAKDAIKDQSPNNGLIRITLKKENNEVIIGVCDNGGGIDPSIKDTISQPYVSTKSKNGTGLGLYMSKTIAQKHLDARLYWNSNETGSCFYIALPSIDEIGNN